eukprot:366405-Chlamydomonas_euryale.AAC.3
MPFSAHFGCGRMIRLTNGEFVPIDMLSKHGDAYLSKLSENERIVLYNLERKRMHLPNASMASPDLCVLATMYGLRV